MKAAAALLAVLLAAACPSKAAEAAAPGPAAGMAAAVTQRAKTATLLATATAKGPNVLVRDVVAEELPPAAGSLVLKAIGRPGARTPVNGGLLALKLRQAPGGPWKVGGAGFCRVEAPAQKVSGAEMMRFARERLEASLSGTAGVSLKEGPVPPDASAYAGFVRLALKLPLGEPRGNVVLRVQLMQEGADGEVETLSVPVSFLVQRREPRVYASRVIRKGDALDQGNLEVKELDSTYTPGEGFPSVESLLGKKARAYIGAGRAVTADLVELPPAIRRGDAVRLLVKSGGVVVEATAKAMRDARVGESLPLEVENTKRSVQARCVEAGVAVRDTP